MKKIFDFFSDLNADGFGDKLAFLVIPAVALYVYKSLVFGFVAYCILLILMAFFGLHQKPVDPESISRDEKDVAKCYYNNYRHYRLESKSKITKYAMFASVIVNILIFSIIYQFKA